MCSAGHCALDPVLAYSHTLSLQLPPTRGPSIGFVRCTEYRTDLGYQCRLAQMTARQDLLPPRLMLTISRGTYAQHAALHTHRP